MDCGESLVVYNAETYARIKTIKIEYMSEIYDVCTWRLTYLRIKMWEINRQNVELGSMPVGG